MSRSKKGKGKLQLKKSLSKKYRKQLAQIMGWRESWTGKDGTKW